jgi:hypothetical protein
MLLTAGTFLQEGRYWVEGILEQDETGISYRAQHRNLNIPVVIQTPGPALSDRPDASQILQSFMAEVRCQSLAPADTPFRVLDCFIEFSQPFVVLELADDAKPPKVTQTWLPGLKDSLIQSSVTQDQASNASPTAPTQQPELIPVSPDIKADTGVPTNGSTVSKTQKDGITPVTQVVSPAPSKNGSKPHSTRVVVSSPVRRSPSWLPISLGITAVIGGCTGAILGWQLRQGKSLSEVVPVVGPKVDVDQSFPPIDGWPASETSDTPGSGAGLDQVLQRRTPEPRERRNRPTVDEPPIEPYRIDYGSDTAIRSEPLPEPEYASDSFDASPPVDDYQEEAPEVTGAADVPNAETPQSEGVNSAPSVAVEEPAPIEKPMAPPPDSPPPPPETAAPRSFRTSPRSPSVVPDVTDTPAEASTPQ